ncbi:DUF1684 domain-containing protein [Stenotrophomonas mori]|uniref:DUF1684 domain-containing protein n=1 Tax=Stenotrophomonas mori TaxID=2871096 RepID=A0ABT0SG59_9GAMM|nr:DUF1684 domain-containing protein [Stenotrophomonas mori]MCL7714058.1 DUF1684 domain-containing protein [Stenotrophomonas mori]
MRARCTGLAGAILAGVLAGCGGGGPGGEERTPRFDAAFVVAHDLWREQRQAELLGDDGWTRLVGLHWLTLKAHYIGSGSTSGIRLAVGPPRLGLVTREGGRYWFTPEPGVAVLADGQPVKGRVPLRADDQAEPTRLVFDDGKGTLGLIRRGTRHALRVRHADAPARAGFVPLAYWPVDPSWRISARFLPHAADKTLPVVDITGAVTEQANAGAVEFEREGRTWQLQALGEPGRPLLLIFADRSNGRGSYAAGRYIDLDVPDAKSRVVIDFNRAYNPPCAFTSYATCPLPPAENRLEFAVEAGEQAYPPRDNGDGT